MWVGSRAVWEKVADFFSDLIDPVLGICAVSSIAVGLYGDGSNFARLFQAALPGKTFKGAPSVAWKSAVDQTFGA